MRDNLRPQRVLMTADTVGGVWTYALELIGALPEVRFALATMGRQLSASQREQIATHSNVVLFESEFRLEWMDDPWSDVDRAGDWLLGLEAKFQPDLVHLNGYAHAVLPWAAPKLVVAHSCVISWWHAVKGGEPPDQFDEYRRRVSTGLAAANLVVAPTQAMLKSLREDYAGEFTGRVIPNGRTHAQFSPAPKLSRIFAAGRVWDEAKNISLLSEIAPRVSWPIDVAGEDRHPGGGSPRLANVNLLGRLTQPQLATRFGTAAIYAAPAKYEPFGLSILEAGLSACALVLGDIASLRELWANAAVFVSPADADGFIRAFDDLISHAGRREELGLRARERALHFTVERMAADYREAYATCREVVETPV